MKSCSEPMSAISQRKAHVVPAGGLFDCEIHSALPEPAALLPYLPERWRDPYNLFGMRHRSPGVHFAGLPHSLSARRDSFPPSKMPPGADLRFTQEQHLDQWDIQRAIVDPIEQLGFGSQPPEYAAALTRALNERTVAEWLDPEPRLLAGLCVPMEDGDLAAEEIDRLGGNPRFVHVLLNSVTRDPLGSRKYWKIYEAATRQDIPVAIHFGGWASANTVTGVGWPSYYVEMRTSLAQSGQCQLVSLVAEGVFERFPNLKVILLEVGYSWLPALMWRFDSAYAQLKREVPHLTREPSDYIRRHFWFATQPVEEPEKQEHLKDFSRWLVEQGMEDRLMYSSDYPHWDFDSPAKALKDFSVEIGELAYGANARALYGVDDDTYRKDMG